jgi:hypothetical protein
VLVLRIDVTVCGVPGFLAPLFGKAFTLGEMRRKKGRREWGGEITECSETEWNNFYLLISFLGA